MALFKKITKKVVQDVKETVAEETHKTTEEIKDEVINKVKEYLPQILMFAGAIIFVGVAKRQPPVTVKVIVKQV